MRHSEAVRQVRHFPTQLRKMAKCMIYIGTYACGECYGKCLTCLTASPRRPRPLDGSVINGTIQQLLDTPQPPQRHTAAQRGFTREDAARPPQRRSQKAEPKSRFGSHLMEGFCPPKSRFGGHFLWPENALPQVATAPHSAPTWFPLPGHPLGCGKAPLWPICAPPSWGSAKQRHTAAQRGFIHEDAARHPQRPHSATQRPNVVSTARTSTRMRQGTPSARTAAQRGFHCPDIHGHPQRHTAAQRGFTARHPRGCGKATAAACQGRAGHFSPLGNLEKQSKGINS